MDLVRLVYYSRIRLDGQLRPVGEQIAEIISASVANNQRDDVTGGLIHDTKWFAQVLEGREQAVSRTFERILRDPRHGAVALVKMQPIPSRHFGQWWMGHAAWSRDNAHLFVQYGDDERFDPQLMTVERLIDLLDAVLRHAAPRAARPANAEAGRHQRGMASRSPVPARERVRAGNS